MNQSFIYSFIITFAVTSLISWLREIFTNSAAPSAPLGSGQFFDKIAPVYDTVNKFMSLGFDDSWRRKLVDTIRVSTTPGSKTTYLDIATGTGDVAILIALKLAHSGFKSQVITGFDPSENMLSRADSKAKALHLSPDLVKFVKGSVLDMKIFRKGSFDKITMSFGIRNVLDRSLALKEIKRVSRKGADVAIMEFQAPRNGMLAPIANAFLGYILPAIGTLASGGLAHEYAHLKDSIFNFPSSEDFISMLTKAGFVECQAENIFLEIVIIFHCRA